MKRLTYREAADYLRIPTGTLRQLVHRRRIPHLRISERTVLFDVAELDVWLAEKHVAAIGGAS